MKSCSRCKEIKEFSEFGKDKTHSSGYKPHCRVCARKDWEKWMAKNGDKQRLKGRITHYIKTYNLSPEMAEKLVENRVGTCAICGNVSPLVVDHCHTTNIVRGLICSSCNAVLGYSKDNTNTLENAIKYLKDFYG